MTAYFFGHPVDATPDLSLLRLIQRIRAVLIWYSASRLLLHADS